VAEVLSRQTDDFAYANLAVRGKLIKQILEEQVEPALALRPDLITISAGGNDVIRPGTDPDQIALYFDQAVRRLASDGATIVVFTGVDVGFSPVFRGIRGKVAIYNENVRAVAARYDCIVADQWSLTGIQDSRMWAPDRLHLAPLGHHTVARMVLAALNVENDLQPLEPEPLPPRTWRRARSEDLSWAREYLVPWVVRRIRHQSSGDHITAKRPDAVPFLLRSED
jgi:lysophospholipase L1-like esterase